MYIFDWFACSFLVIDELRTIYLKRFHFCSVYIVRVRYWRSKLMNINVDENFEGYDIWTATWQNQQSGCAPSEDSDQPGHPPSLIRVFAVRMKKAWVLSYPLSAQRRLWSDCADAQADLSLRWAHTHFIGFVMSRLMYIWVKTIQQFEAYLMLFTTVPFL